jgi:hypothetical protein
MFVRANTGWSEVVLESITPEEALWIIQLQADRLTAPLLPTTMSCHRQWPWWPKLWSGTRESETALKGYLFERRPLCP